MVSHSVQHLIEVKIEIEIRDERPEDAAAIRTVNERAFGQAREADIVDALRKNGVAFVNRHRRSPPKVRIFGINTPINMPITSYTRRSTRGVAPVSQTAR